MGMPMVQVDEELHEQVKKLVKERKTEYPTIQFFVNTAIKDKLRIELIEQKEIDVE